MIELVGEDKALLQEWSDRFKSADEGLHRHHRTVWNRMDKLYHGYRQVKTAYADGDPSRYPQVRSDAQAEFGHELFIPYAYSIVETVLPRLLSNRPRMLVLPRNQQSEANVENMRALIDDQQNRINYEIRVQETAKSGLMYGLGVQKTYWASKKVSRQEVIPAGHVLRAAGKKWALNESTETICDDPRADAVDIRDFFWDPYATSIEDARWVIHRTWRDTGYILDKITPPGPGEPAQWDYASLTREDLDNGGGAAMYQQAHAGPREAQHMPNVSPRDTDIHEVWECHDRTHVTVVINRECIVSTRANEAYPGRLPFQIYRPTHILNQFVGMGEIQPIEDLQDEMNMLRTHRRWNAEMVMHKAFFYNDGLIDTKKFKIGPGALIPINGDPKDVLMPIEMGDVPYSSYREAQEIAADIERASGISDSTAGADAGAAQTATGIQLVQAAANARIQLKTRRVEVELIREGCRHWGRMNQRFILEQREVQVPAPPTPEEPDRTSVWLKLGPAELAGEFDYEPEGGSTTPENIPQMRQDAQIKMAAMGQIGQMLDARRFVTMILEDLGVKNAETYLAPDVHVPPGTLDLIVQQLGQMGMDPGQAQELVAGSLNAALDAEQQEQQPASSDLPREPEAGQQAA